MNTQLLDKAFHLLVDRDVKFDPMFSFAERDKARLHELRRLFPDEAAESIEAADREARRLLDVACDFANLSRGPDNDGKGMHVVPSTLEGPCPGFSGPTYAAALSQAMLLTR